MKFNFGNFRLITTFVITMLLIVSSILPMTATAQTITEPTSGSLPAGVTPDAIADAKAYISCRPTTVGVGQTILANMWITPSPGASRKCLDFKITITDPQGEEFEIVMDSYPNDGTAWFEYPMDKVGVWKIKFDFVGMYFPPGTYGVDGEYLGSEDTSGGNMWGGPQYYSSSAYYPPSFPDECTIIVQEDPIYSWQSDAVTSDYWKRPVAYEHREWATILGDYPYTGVGSGYNYPEDTNIYASDYDFTPYVQGPNSAHVVWKQQHAIAGILGGDYEQKITDATIFEMSAGYNPDIIYAGRGYQAIEKAINGEVKTFWVCYDIRTGETYWELEAGLATIPWPGWPGYFLTTTVVPDKIEYQFGQLGGGGGSPTQAVTTSLIKIVGGRLIKWSPMTGAITGNYSIAPLDSGIYYKNGYALSVQSTNEGYRLLNWTTFGSSWDVSSRIVSNITWPISSVDNLHIDYEVGVGAVASPIEKSGSYVGMNAYGISLTTGEVLWNITTNDIVPYQSSCDVADHGKLAVLTNRGYYVAYDLLTGDEAWTSEVMDYPWDESSFGAYNAQSAYGLLYRQAYSGIYAFDWDNGNIVWKFEQEADPYETPYINEEGKSVYSWNNGAKIADGKMYVYTTEHSASVPITRGWGLFCINAHTGEYIWDVSLPGAASKHSTDMGAIADGYLTVFSSDGYMYVYGKGESETTITAPNVAVTQGQSVVLTGTVLDQSPAQTGTPCISKESMGTYMEYIHKQLEIPSDVTVTGVPVSLDTIDPNGNFVHIADVTTDMSGTYGYLWTPEVPGQHAVTATFAGDDSYGSSWAQTYVGVVESPVSTPIEPEEPTETPVEPTEAVETPFITTEIAVIAAVAIAAIIGVAAYFLLKRK